MKKSRRTFLETSLKTGLMLPFISSLFSCESSSKKVESTDRKKLNILILGGTSFLGPHQIAYALERGHSISIFTRGKTKSTIHKEVFEKVEHLIGDREDNLTTLENREWDAVIDNSGGKTAWTRKTAELLKDKVELYLYVSSTGVYYPYLGNDIDETTKILLEEPPEEQLKSEDEKLEYWYGVMKATSENAAKNAFGEDRTIVVRPTYMFGPGDKTDRFIHWPIRLAKGGEVLVPGSEDLVQYLDVRDAAEFMIRLIEDKKTGTFNAAGPKSAQSMLSFVEEASTAFDTKSNFVTIDDYEFFKTQNIPYLVPWIMPEGNNFGSARANNQKGIAAGLAFRDLKTSIKDMHDWWYSDALTEARRAKFEANEKSVLVREKALIEAWRAK